MSIWQIFILGVLGLFLKYTISVILSNIDSKEERSVLEKRTHGQLANQKSNENKSLLEKRVYGRKEGKTLC